MNPLEKHTHCSSCGSKYTELLWPRKCTECSGLTYSNPIPVVVALIRVIRMRTSPYESGEKYRYGTLIVQRGINPKKGDWALPGGYVDHQETWEEAAAREVFEETGFQTHPWDYKLWNITSSTTKDNMLIFGEYKYDIPSNELERFKPNSEVLALDVMWKPTTLAFPAHTEQAFQYHLTRVDKEERNAR